MALAACLVAFVCWVLNRWGGVSIPAGEFLVLRGIALLLFGVYAAERRSLTYLMLLGMMIGAEFGHDWPGYAVHLRILGTIFLRLIQVIIAPLLFSTLVVGIAGSDDLRKVGRMAFKALAYFEIVSTFALLVGAAAIHLTRAGVGASSPAMTRSVAINAVPLSVSEVITNIFPENIAKSVAEGNVLQVVVFSILFGLALALLPKVNRRPLLALANSLSQTMYRFTNLIMWVAPLGLLGATAYSIGHLGLGVLVPLGKVLATMYCALAVFILGGLLPIALVIRVPLVRFLKAVAEPVAIAFSTASSEAALPRAMEQMEGLGIARETIAFVLPTGYSFNLDGSSLYQSIALIFVVQASGLHLSWRNELTMLLTLLVSSKGTAGVARASFFVVLTVVTSFHLPSEPLFLLLGIDPLMDMGRTGVNVLGNCLATVVVARWEGETGVFSPARPLLFE